MEEKSKNSEEGTVRESSGQRDYFNPADVKYRYDFPDGVSYVEFRKLTDGDRVRIEDMNSTIEMDRNTDTMRLDAKGGTRRHVVIKIALTDWNLKEEHKGKLRPINMTKQAIDRLLRNLDPSIVDDMYDVVVKHNKWLKATSQKTREELQGEIDKIRQEMERKEEKKGEK